ncbi:MAG: TonB family protein [Myxococcaceae bacterium]
MVLGVYKRAFVVSLSLHVMVVAGLVSLEPAPPVPRAPPLEVDLVFKVPEARRAPPTVAPPPRASTPAAAAPRRARAQSVPVAAVPLPAPVAVTAPLAPVVPIVGSVGSPFGPAGPGGPGGRDGGERGSSSNGAGTDQPGVATEPARVLWMPEVEYPESARIEELDGVVRLLVELDGTGRVVKVLVVESPAPVLGAAAREALLRARFSPATRGGVPEQTQFEYRYRFELR